jgi:hypothetical protein
MHELRNSALAIVSTVAIGAFSLSIPSAQADEEPAAPCATQQAQVDRAAAKLEALTAKFAAHPSKKVKKAKKAQVQRVTRATARLDACVARTTVDTGDDGDDTTPETPDAD